LASMPAGAPPWSAFPVAWGGLTPPSPTASSPSGFPRVGVPSLDKSVWQVPRPTGESVGMKKRIYKEAFGPLFWCWIAKSKFGDPNGNYLGGALKFGHHHQDSLKFRAYHRLHPSIALGRSQFSSDGSNMRARGALAPLPYSKELHWI
jgi:hypothetical protein